MKVQKIFKRKEMKYLLSADQKKKLMESLSPYLKPDLYPDYDIYSLYYDNKDLDWMRRSLDKPVYKEKLRLRSYGPIEGADDSVFLEIKKKYKGIVYKRRVDLPAKDVKGFKDKEAVDGSSREINRLLRNEKLEPKLAVRYHRKAYTWKDDSELRITFDDEVISSFDDLSMKNHFKGEDLLDSGQSILEIKGGASMPLPLVRTLEKLHIYPTSVSKAGLAMKSRIEEERRR